MNARATIAHLGWLAASLPAYRRFTRALRSPAASQAEWLQDHLRANSETAYGRRHGAHEVRDYAEFARRVPVITYSELEPWIERVKRGETNLLSREPITRLLPTSGSTGARKL